MLLWAVWFFALQLHADDQPKYAASATRLSQSHEYLEKHAAPDFWSLIGYYIAQKDEGACAPASLSMVLNAMRSGTELRSKDRLITQQELYSKIDIFKEGGDPGTFGVGLEGIGRILAKAMKLNSIQGWSYEVVRAEASPEWKKKLHELLVKNEKSKDDFLIALFLQGTYTGDSEGNKGGHFAPVGAYDGKRVLILDPDREWYEPYWISEELFFRGMTAMADTTKRGGYLHVWK